MQSFVYYGLIYILPEAFNNGDEGGKEAQALKVMLSAAIEFPGIILTMLIVDLPSVGRKPLMVWCMAGCAAAVTVCSVATPRVVFFWCAIGAKMLINGSFGVVYVYTGEAYPTEERASGLGMGSAASRVGGILTPFTSELALARSFHAPFQAFAAVSFLGAIAAFFLPSPTASPGKHAQGLADEAGDDGNDPRDLVGEPTAAPAHPPLLLSGAGKRSERIKRLDASSAADADSAGASAASDEAALLPKSE